MKVLKFGGTSVGSIESLQSVKKIVSSRQERVIVVVSAMSGVTNSLIAMCDQARQGDEQCLQELPALAERHHAALKAVSISGFAAYGDVMIDKFINESLAGHLRHLIANRELPEQEQQTICDTVIAHGELLSSLLVSSMFEGCDAAFAPDFIKTRPDGDGRVLDWAATERAIHEQLGAVTAQCVVTQGFIAKDAETGRITNLGRGGSDYTAAIIAAVLDAEALEIWTDVDGFMTADPRTHPDATVIDEMTYEQAQAMCDAGAKVIYAPTIAPVAQKGIPVWVKNTFNPDCRGTVIQSSKS